MSSHQYDVVLLDLNLPVPRIVDLSFILDYIPTPAHQVMDGFETVRQFRSLEKERLANVAAAMETFSSDVSSMSEEQSSEQEVLNNHM